MSAVVLPKSKVIEQITKIAVMSEKDLKDYQVNLSTSNIDSKAKGFLYRAVEEREAQFNKRHEGLAVDGDISDIGGSY